MDLKHFGDSYDIVKKSLLHWLADFGPWKAHPMFTDLPMDVHRETRVQEFKEFLGVPFVSDCELTQYSDRDQYFDCGDCRSLFLDPTTGIARPKQTLERSKRPKYILASDLAELTCQLAGLTLTFDQSLARGSEKEHIQMKLAYFSSRNLHGFAYVSHASFVVLGQSADLVSKAHRHLLAESLLPGHRIVTTAEATKALKSPQG